MSTSIEIETLNEHKEEDRTGTDMQENVIKLSLGQDIYTCFLLLLEKNIYSQQMNKFEKCGITLLSLFAVFIQVAGVIFFQLYDQKIFSSEVEIKYFTDPDTLPSYTTNAIIYEYVGIQYQDKFSFNDYLVRLIAYCVLLAYLTSTMSDVPKWISVAACAKYWYLFIIMTFFQLFVITITVSKITVLINDQTATVDIFGVGVGFIILLEVDDYCYKSIHSTFSWFNDDLFIYIFNKDNVKNTVFGTKICNRFSFTPFQYQVFTFLCTIPSMMVMSIINVYYFNTFGESTGDKNTELGPLYSLLAPFMVILAVPYTIPLVLACKSCKSC